MSMPGFLIALEGLDQSGKETQAQLLRDWLRGEGHKAADRVLPGLRHVDR